MRATYYLTERIGPKQSLTPEGFLLCADVPLARTGMMIYGPDETPIAAGPDGIVKIMREPDDVFTAETIGSAQGKSVTNDHPEDDVVPENWRELTHGFMMNVRRGEGMLDDLLLGDLLVTTPEGIEAVRSGKVEVSLGYEADYDETGEPGAGTGKQTNIIINHIALVDQGRCGPRCAIGDAKPTLLRSGTMKTKGNRILDALMKAFKAKDASEVEELAKKVEDEFPEEKEGTKDEGSGETHIHIHGGGQVTSAEGGMVADQGVMGDPAAVRAEGSDDDLWAQNASEHADMSARIAALEAKLTAMEGNNVATGDDESDLPQEALDEFPEELKAEASKAKDSVYMGDSFRNAVGLAEILVPGIRIPTYDRAQKPGTTFKKICGLRRQALDLAYAQPATRSIVDDILDGKELNTKSMTCDAVRTLFNAAAAAKRTANNTAGAKDTGANKRPAKKAPTTLAELNALNGARYGSK